MEIHIVCQNKDLSYRGLNLFLTSQLVQFLPYHCTNHKHYLTIQTADRVIYHQHPFLIFIFLKRHLHII